MSTRNLTAVEGLRFLLFLGVFVFHCAGSWFPVGWGGVEAFLVIGAFFLTRKLLKIEQRDIAVCDVFIHRIKRLYPVYIILIIAVVAFKAFSIHQISVDSLWYLFSLQNFRCLFNGSWNSLDGFLGHFWYIGLDIWLFLIWVVLMRLVPKGHLRKTFIIMLCVGLLWRTLFIYLKPESPSYAYVIPLGQLDCWSIGGLIALNISEKGNSRLLKWFEIIIGFVGIILIIWFNAFKNKCGYIDSYMLLRSANGYMNNPFTGNIHFFIAVLSAGVLRYCLEITSKHPILSATPLVVLGGMSYELYCFHYPILSITRFYIDNDVLMVISTLLATVLVTLLWNKLAMPIVKRVIK